MSICVIPFGNTCWLACNKTLGSFANILTISGLAITYLFTTGTLLSSNLVPKSTIASYTISGEASNSGAPVVPITFSAFAVATAFA